MVLISLLKHTKISKLSLLLVTAHLLHHNQCFIVCSFEHGAEKILRLSNIQQMSAIQQWELFIHTYMYL